MVCNAMQPIAHGFPVLQLSCLLHQHEKRCLEGIFDIVGADQHPPADVEDHRSMPADQRGKGCLLGVNEEAVE